MMLINWNKMFSAVIKMMNNFFLSFDEKMKSTVISHTFCFFLFYAVTPVENSTMCRSPDNYSPVRNRLRGGYITTISTGLSTTDFSTREDAHAV